MHARGLADTQQQPLSWTRSMPWLCCLGVMACQPTGGATLVSAPAPDEAAAGEPPVTSASTPQDPPLASASSAPDAPAGDAHASAGLCPADTHRQWTCGRPSNRSPDQANAPVAIADCPKESFAVSQQWRMVAFPGAMSPDPARTQELRERGKDEVGQAVDAVCCYSACVPLEVRATADPTPADHNTTPLCIAAGEAPSKVPASGRADCAAAIKLPGYRSYGGFNAASTNKEGQGYADRSGFPAAKTCCYDGLQPKRITR